AAVAAPRSRLPRSLSDAQERDRLSVANTKRFGKYVQGRTDRASVPHYATGAPPQITNASRASRRTCICFVPHLLRYPRFDWTVAGRIDLRHSVSRGAANLAVRNRTCIIQYFSVSPTKNATMSGLGLASRYIRS